MVNFSFVAGQAWAVVLFSIAVTVLVFPVVFSMALAYEWLEKRQPKAPKVLLMLATTFLGVLLAVLLLEIYLEYTLPQVLSAALE